jgi:serine phosphatase RsbU (regulator of sigma subunit)
MVSPLKKLMRVFIIAFIIIIAYLLIEGKIKAIYLATENMFSNLKWTHQIVSSQIQNELNELSNCNNAKDLSVLKREQLLKIDSVWMKIRNDHELNDFGLLLFFGKDTLQYRMQLDSTFLFSQSPITDLEKGAIYDEDTVYEKGKTSGPRVSVFVKITSDGSREFLGMFSPIEQKGGLKVVYAVYKPIQSWFKIIEDELFANILVLVCIIGITIFFTVRSVKKIIRAEQEIKTRLFDSNIELNRKNEEITDSIKYARSLQDAVLMKSEDIMRILPESFIFYQPKDIVAGDFYWVLEHNDQIFYAAADCTGHGVPGAMVSMICANALNHIAAEYNNLSASLLLDKTRAEVIKSFTAGNNIKDGMDISLIIFNKTTRQLQWSGAFNPLWVINKISGKVTELKGDKQPIAAYSDIKPFTNHTVLLNEGDVFYLFTDGYADQFGGPKDKKFRYKALQELLVSVVNLPFDSQKKELEQVFKSWKGNREQVDDVLVMGVEFK